MQIRAPQVRRVDAVRRGIDLERAQRRGDRDGGDERVVRGVEDVDPSIGRIGHIHAIERLKRGPAGGIRADGDGRHDRIRACIDDGHGPAAEVRDIDPLADRAVAVPVPAAADLRPPERGKQGHREQDVCDATHGVLRLRLGVV